MNEVLETIRENLAALESRLASYSKTILGQGHVIMSNGCVLCFDIDRTTRALSNPKPVGLAGSGFLMLDREEAERIAANVLDGNGKPAEAIHIVAALKRAIEEERALLAALELKMAA